MRPSVEGGGDLLRSTNLSQGTDVGHYVQQQLTGAVDVKAAHAFFQPTGAEAHLPAMNAVPGAESAVHVAAGKAGEAAVMVAAKAGEGAAMSAAQQAGANAISPIIQLIMRLPGHIGLMSSFFEALGHFLIGQDILHALDPTHLLMEHAAEAMHSVTETIGEHLGGLDVSHLAEDSGSVFHATSEGMTGTEMAGATPSTDIASASSESATMNASAPGELSKLQFEHEESGFNSSLNDGSQHAFAGSTDPRYLAWDTGASSFRPSFSGGQTPTASVNPTATPSTPAPTTGTAPSTGGAERGLAAAHDTGAAAASPEHGSLLGNNAPSHQMEAAQSENATDAGAEAKPESTADGAAPQAEQPANVEYTVRHGDNLWDIARKHMGDATKWTEIYKLNQNLIGDNPSLIHEGLNLQLPSHDIASADVTVQPGDNLWNLAKSHLGGGEHWPEIYHANHDLIGSNPSLIHPGQHFTMSGGTGEHLASADVGTHASHHITAAHAHSAHLAHASHTPHAPHVAHNAAPQHVAHAAGAGHHEQIAEAAPSEHASKLASSAPKTESLGPQVALKAQAGSLASFQQVSAGGE